MVMSRHPLWLSGTGRFRSDSMSATRSRSSRTGFLTSYRWCASLRRDACKWMCPHSAGRGAGRAQTHSHADERACISLARMRWRGGLGKIAEILGSCQSPCDRACARRWRPGALNAKCLMAQAGLSGATAQSCTEDRCAGTATWPGVGEHRGRENTCRSRSRTSIRPRFGRDD
jgi:hypothetical protein